jgi:hypothetical protein
MALDSRLAAVLAFAGGGLVTLAIVFALDRAPVEPDAAAGPRVAVAGSGTPAAHPGATTVRQAVEAIGRRHGVRIVIDDAVRADLPAPYVPVGDLEADRLESALRELLAGNELVFHYGVGPGRGGVQLKVVWVFSRLEDFAVRATAWAGSAPAAADEGADPRQRLAALDAPPGAAPAMGEAAPGRGSSPDDENARSRASRADPADTMAPDLNELRKLAEADEPEAVRMQALEDYLMHPDATEDEVLALLDRLSHSAEPMLAEHARTLREARTAAVQDADLNPEPIEDKP